MWFLYQVLYGLVLALAAPFLVLRRGTHYLPTIPGRLTFHPGISEDHGGAAGNRTLWIHAVSVGEVGVAATLVEGLESSAPTGQRLLVTTITPTGQARARKLFAGRASVAASVAYLPFDLAPLVNRFFRRHQPDALILVEGDFWPRVLRGAAHRGLPVAVVNGRVGDRSFRRLRRLRKLPGGRRLLGVFFDPVTAFGVQSAADRDRLASLGVAPERITVTGNLKYETPEPPRLEALAADLAKLAAGRPILVAGSTMEGEEEAVLAALRTATRNGDDESQSPGSPDALLVLAPRHPERWDEVARRIEAAGLRLWRRSHGSASQSLPSTEPSSTDAASTDTASTEPYQVLLLDSLGELATVYRHAAAAFIGGTLVPTGGHNPLEAARFGLPTAVGPSMENFRDMAATFDQRDAWARVADGAELGRTWKRWLADPSTAAAVGDRARELVAANRGALERTQRLLAPLLQESRGDLASQATPPRSPWQRLYGAVHRWRRASSAKSAESLPRPVVSIGNLHLGGGGKTPLTAAIAAHLRDADHRVSILSRGYKAPKRDGIRVVDPEVPSFTNYQRAGDEPTLLAEDLPGVAVVVAKARVAAGHHALRHVRPAPELFLLDDGFSHLRLHRDLDLLAFPAADPLAGGRLLPSGQLREPLASARHADAVLLTGLPVDPETGERREPGAAGQRKAAELATALHPFGFTGPAFACALEIEPLRWVEGERIPEPGAALMPVCGLARDEGFLAAAREQAEAAGFQVTEPLTFGDHHPYPPWTVRMIRRSAEARGATAILTTGKDRVKLVGRLGLPLAEIPVRARPEAAFWDWLDERMDHLLKPPAPREPAEAARGDRQAAP